MSGGGIGPTHKCVGGTADAEDMLSLRGERESEGPMVGLSQTFVSFNRNFPFALLHATIATFAKVLLKSRETSSATTVFPNKSLGLKAVTAHLWHTRMTD